LSSTHRGGRHQFEPGPAQANLVAEIRDGRVVTDVLEWSRTVNIVDEAEVAADATETD
jgi:hypothetical protein